MSKHKITVLKCVPGHCDITGNKNADALAKKVPVLSHKPQTGSYQAVLSSRNPKELQEDESPQNIADTLHICNCKHA
jgi:hypothetical protein